MLSIDTEVEKSLQAIALQEHRSPNEILKVMLSQYIQQKQSSGLLVDVANALPKIACFENQDPLQLQKDLRDEWH